VIAVSDAIELPPGVELRDDALVDMVRQCAIPLNAAALAVLRAATVDDAAETLAAAGAADGRRDALSFCHELNARGLLNVRIPLGARLLRRLHGLRYGLILHAPVRRIDVPGAAGVARAVAPSAALLAAALLPLGVLAGVVAAAAAVVTGAGIVLHEVGHALALRGLPYALILDGLRPELLHERVAGQRGALVAAAGPLMPALVAVCLSLAFTPIAPVLAPLAAHALGLSVLAEDGRRACGLS
jgi:hypothetical protein